MAYFIEVQKRIDAATPTETPQISTEAAKAENEPTEGAKREEISANCLYWDFLSHTIKERMCALTKVTEHLYYIDKGGKYVTLVRFLNGVYWIEQCNAEYLRDAFDATRPEYNNFLRGLNAYQTAEDFVAKYEGRIENGYYLGEFDMELYKRITDITQTAGTVNVSAEGEKEAERAEMPQILNCEWQTVEHFKAIPNIAKLAKAGIIINGVGWHTEYLDKSHKTLARVDNLGWDMKMHTFPYQGSGVFGKTELFENWEDAVIATIDALTDYLRTKGTQPPQSPETPQTVECITNTTKPRETARKPQNRAIGSAQAARCDTLRDTLRSVTHVPRECSTTEASYW